MLSIHTHISSHGGFILNMIEYFVPVTPVLMVTSLCHFCVFHPSRFLNIRDKCPNNSMPQAKPSRLRAFHNYAPKILSEEDHSRTAQESTKAKTNIAHTIPILDRSREGLNC